MAKHKEHETLWSIYWHKNHALCCRVQYFSHKRSIL